MYSSGYYGVDIWYLVLVLPAFLVTLYAQWKVKSTFKEFSGYRTASGITGEGAALSAKRAFKTFTVFAS